MGKLFFKNLFCRLCKLMIINSAESLSLDMWVRCPVPGLLIMSDNGKEEGAVATCL